MVRSLVRFIGWRHLRLRPLRTTLTILGVALGVALFTAMSAINDSTLQFFRDNVSSMTGKATFTVFGAEAGFPEEKVDVVKGIAGVKYAVPMIESHVRFEGGTGRRALTLVVLGIDLLQEAAVRSYQVNRGKGDEEIIDDPLSFLNQADSLIVTRSFGADNGLTIDAPLDLVTPHGRKRFIVRGMLTPSGVAKAFGGGIAIMDIDGARIMFGKEGKVDRIDIVPREGEDEEALSARIGEALGPGYRVERRNAQGEGFSRMVKGYQGLLSFLSSLALLVGVFLVANTVTMAVSERHREISILRALGASRSGVLALFVLESAVVGLVGGAVGVLLGRGLAALLVDGVSQSMSRQYMTPIDVSDIHFRASHAVSGLLAGTLSAAAAALIPAWRAANVRGSEAFGAARGDVSAAAPSRRRLAVRGAGLAMLLALSLTSHFELSTRHPIFEASTPLFGAIGTALAAPWFVVLGLRGLRWLLMPARSALGRATVLRLACENLLRTPRRTGNNALGLIVGLMLVVVVTTIHQSFERSIAEWQGRTLRSDIIVSSAGRIGTLQVEPIHEDLAAEVDHVPGVDLADGRGARAFRFVRTTYDGRQVGLKAVDPQHPRVGYALFDVRDRPATDAGHELFSAADPVIMVSENFRAHFGKKTGQSIELDTPTGRIRFRIVGIAVDFANPEGVIYMSREVYKRYWNDPLVTALAVEVVPGAAPEMVRAEIDAKLGQRGLVAIQNRELREHLTEAMNESFAYTRAIEGAALGVGLLGLMGTLIMSLMERTRELGMLRAIGMSRGQLVRMVVFEALLLSGAGGAVAGALGLYLSHAWVVGSLASSLGWIIHVHVPWRSVLSTMGTGLLVGVVASVFSARHVAKIAIREALEDAS